MKIQRPGNCAEFFLHKKCKKKINTAKKTGKNHKILQENKNKSGKHKKIYNKMTEKYNCYSENAPL